MAVVAEAHKLLGCAYISTRGPGQRTERGLRPVPGRLEVAVIERDQCARAFENSVRLFRQRGDTERCSRSNPLEPRFWGVWLSRSASA